jgi:hypothetical protein
MPFIALPYSQETISEVSGPSGEMEVSVSHSPIDGGDDLNSTPDTAHDHPANMHGYIDRTISEHY